MRPAPPASARALGITLALALAASSVPSAAPAASTVTLAPPGEPGERFEVHGVVYESDGRTPARGARVSVYHTDARGSYSPGQDRARSRLAGTAVTGADGGYRFLSIWPGPYPGGRTPRHVHYEVASADGRRIVTELQFGNDPALPAAQRDRAREAARRGDRFHPVQDAPRDRDGVRRTRFDLRLPARAGT
jgi:protocatechuate 3,4-dioxygenase beta subunit